MHRQPELQHCFQANPSISDEQTHTSGLRGIYIGARLRNKDPVDLTFKKSPPFDKVSESPMIVKLRFARVIATLRD